MSVPNPYRWDLDRPEHHVPREELHAEVARALLRGKAVRIVGGRGTGKTVLLRELERSLRQEPGTRVVRLREPPLEPSEAAALADLADRLGLSEDPPRSLEALLARVCPDDDSRLVLLLDEADQYVQFADRDHVNASFVRAWTNRLEAQRKESNGRLGIVIAGGLGLLFLAHELGSALVGRAEQVILHPFTRAEMEELASPFTWRGNPLDDATLDTFYVLTGGHPALLTFGFEHLWDEPAPSPRAAERIFGDFRDRHGDFLRQVQAAISRRGMIEAPLHALRLVHQYAGAVPMARLRDACATDPPAHIIDPDQALRLLEAAGLIRVEGTPLADPVAAWPVASILNLPERPAETGSVVERAAADVAAVLACLHRFGLDFYRDDKLLHEEVFSSVLATGLRLVGWQHVERESLQKGGFADVKVLVERPSLQGHVLVEVKKWSNDDAPDVQKQVYDYRTAETLGAVVVMIAASSDAVKPDAYEKRCLAGVTFERLPEPSDLRASWRVAPPGQSGTFQTVHLLVEMPRRAKKTKTAPEGST